MEGALHELDALIKFSTERWKKWSDHVGKKQVLDVANSEWSGINQSHGWVARNQHAVQQVVPPVHDVREQWNLLVAYELYIGTPLKVPDLVFMPGELERDQPEIWVKRLDRYRVAYETAIRQTLEGEEPRRRRRQPRSPGSDAGRDRRDRGLQ